MKRNFVMFLALGLLLAFMIPSSALAQGEQPDQWWLRSSMTDGPSDDFQKHIELEFVPTDISGNADGKIITAKASVYLRKGRITLPVWYTHDEQDYKTVTGSKIKSKKTSLIILPTFDLTEKFFVEAGHIREHDSNAYIDNRSIVLGGAGMAFGPGRSVMLIAGVGKQSTDMDAKQIASLNNLQNLAKGQGWVPASEPDIKKSYDETGIYIRERFAFPLAKMLFLTQSLFYLQMTDEMDKFEYRQLPAIAGGGLAPIKSGKVKHKTADFNIALNFIMSPQTMLVGSFTRKYDNNPLFNGVAKTNDTKTVYIKVTFD